MYYDEEDGRYYASKRDAEKIKLWTRLKQGELRRIEGFSRYTITPEGEVFNISRARRNSVQIAPTGRLTISLLNDSGAQRTLGLARLIAHHFIPQPDEDQYYDVGHIDGDFNNVHPSNLVWVARWKHHAKQENYGIDIS